MYMLNRYTRSRLKTLFCIVRHSVLSAYVQPSRNTKTSPRPNKIIEIFYEKGYNESTARKKLEDLTTWVDHYF